MLLRGTPDRVPGTAVFMTGQPDASQYFKIPTERAIEIGTQIAI